MELCRLAEVEPCAIHRFYPDLYNPQESILLIRTSDQTLYAVSPLCPNCGADLENGLLDAKAIVCPLAGCTFNLENGYPIEGPSFRGLHSYTVSVDSSERVYLRLPDRWPTSCGKDFRQPVALDSSSTEIIVVIGAGATATSFHAMMTIGSAAVETLRREGYAGRIIMISAEVVGGINRPEIFRSLETFDPLLPPVWWFEEDYQESLQCDCYWGCEVVKVDADKKLLSLLDGRSIQFSKLLIASGSIPRIAIGVPGMEDCKNVHMLGSMEEIAAAARSCQDARNIVILGEGIMALEFAHGIATTPSSLEKTITLVSEAPVLRKLFGNEVSGFLCEFLAEQGVQLESGCQVIGLEKDSAGMVTKMVLDNGTSVPVDAVILCLGWMPNTAFLRSQESGVRLTERGAVEINKDFSAGRDIWAAGDCATILASIHSQIYAGDEQQWQRSLRHGERAALSLLGKASPKGTGLTVLTSILSKSNKCLRFVGQPSSEMDMNQPLIRDLGNSNFAAFYHNTKTKDITAVAVMGSGSLPSLLCHLFSTGRLPSLEELGNLENLGQLGACLSPRRDNATSIIEALSPDPVEVRLNPLLEEHNILCQLFSRFDPLETGSISVEHLPAVLELLGDRLEEEELQAAINRLDEDKSRKVKFATFVTWWQTIPEAILDGP